MSSNGFYLSVTATLPNMIVARNYLNWVTSDNGPIKRVMGEGAVSGLAVLLDSSPPASSEVSIATQYVFGSRESFDRYQFGPVAKSLREEGAKRFASSGIKFSRATGEIKHSVSS